MNSYFITGTDTGVGKTHVTARILAELRRRGIDAAGFKPIACGTGGRHDAEIYRAIGGGALAIDEINPVYLKHPLAPSVAARIEKRKIDPRRICDGFDRLAAKHDMVLVEGAGGLMVPIKRGYFVADLVRDLDLPLLIVARLGLGTINHSLLTVREAERSGLKIAGIILNDLTGRRHGLAERTNIAEIEQLSGVPLLGVMAYITETKPPRDLRDSGSVGTVCNRLLRS